MVVYKDNWLPRLETFKPISPPSLPRDTMVAELIKNENQWDLDKLQQHFRVEDIEIIQKILLLSQYSKDEVMWHFDKKGEYSTKSGYQLALKINCPEAPSSSNNSSKN